MLNTISGTYALSKGATVTTLRKNRRIEWEVALKFVQFVENIKENNSRWFEYVSCMDKNALKFKIKKKTKS